MKYYLTAASVALFAMSASALAQEPSPTMTKLTDSECADLWQKAGGGASGLTESQSAPYVSDFKAANPDGDTTIDQDEWTAACGQGLVHAASANSASSADSDASANKPEKVHPPTNRMDEAVPDMKSPEK